MYSKFLNQSDEKKDKIINASIKEFAQKGYTLASTNQIVKAAEISKGLLFHYFNTKKSLYLFLYDYCVELCLKEFYGKMDSEDTDIFTRLEKGILIKMDLLLKYPDMFEFLQIALSDDSDEIKSALDNKKRELMNDSYKKLFSGLDYSNFKAGIDLTKAMNIIMWTFEGFSNAELRKSKALGIKELNYNEMFKEGEKYIQILKDIFYK
ncbi:MAG TPA: TetR/AcrR family transcriptional regulator [Clostridiaceae bacterium]